MAKLCTAASAFTTLADHRNGLDKEHDVMIMQEQSFFWKQKDRWELHLSQIGAWTK